MKTKCDGVKDLLIEYLEGELSNDDAKAVERHLGECEQCAAECAAFERTYALLREDGYEEPLSFFWTRFNARIRERMRERSTFGVRRWQTLAPRLVPVAAAVLCFGIGLWIGVRPGPDAVPGATRQAQMAQVGRGTPLAAAPTAVVPVVSARSKYLADSGAIQPSHAPAADTLRPDTFDPFAEDPRIMLATSEREAYRMADTERLLRDRLPGE